MSIRRLFKIDTTTRIQPLDFTLPDDRGQPFSVEASWRGRGPAVFIWLRGPWCAMCRLWVRGFQKHIEEFEALGATIVFITANTPEENREFRRRVKMDKRFQLLSDEEHRTADHYGIPICYYNPRPFVYPHGFIQPAVFAYHGEREIFRYVQRPAFWNLNGALWRPSPGKVLRALRRASSTSARG